MQIFSYIITDLGDYVSDPIDVTLESADEALTFGKYIAGEMLERMPDVSRRGWCITIRDLEKGRIAIVPIDSMN